MRTLLGELELKRGSLRDGAHFSNLYDTRSRGGLEAHDCIEGLC